MMELESSLEAFDETDRQNDRILKRLRLGDESHLMRVMSMEQSRLIDVAGLEGIDRHDIQSAAAAISRGAAIAWQNTGKLIEFAHSKIDTTGKKSLELARRQFSNSDGHLSESDKSILDKKLATSLHVDGEVPDNLNAHFKDLITFASYLRTSVIPQMLRELNAVTSPLNGTPKSIDEIEDMIDKVAAAASKVKNLPEHVGRGELTKQRPGGLCLGKDGSYKSIKTKSKDRIANWLIERINRNEGCWVEVLPPSKVRVDAASSTQVTLLSRQEAAEAFNVATHLIGVGVGLRDLARKMGKISGAGTSASLVQNIRMLETVADRDHGGKLSPETREKMHLLIRLFSHSTMQQDKILASMAMILFSGARAYIRLIETSVQRYK